MNKASIKKYKAEFDHWLNDGELLYLFHERDLKIYMWSTTYDTDYDKGPFDIDYDITDNHIKSIVINDEYVELRKALAEGKTIQAKDDLSSNKYYNLITPIWFNLPVGCYRIKPEEPRFKEGDWVRIVNCDLVKNQKEIFCIDFIDNKNNCFGINSDTEYCNMNYLELWKPEPGEYCWFYKKDSNNPVFAKFERNIDSNLGSYEAVGFVPNGPHTSDKEQFGYFDRCKPFIGTLPTFLKDK